ncbi:hypothetical protein GCM10008107_01190 [Psychrosphaera saromensis]|uniref:hypothetical protein n=1 Tax=Psychrosphaera saromensis TaxID=716813 RepID=UPI0015E362C5|nr:hypothetical protein [Psychrosphaera saromensis]GHB56159.1 hypothetical protein GCM10008107_01190 [Psychrosphaera saromensis]GLQ13841.1 hypothetical protein GCM10007917_12960 [Psychrosphaera saromensis]
MIFLIDIIEQYLNKYILNTNVNQQAQVCNYQDNYYGDQLCLFVESSFIDRSFVKK